MAFRSHPSHLPLEADSSSRFLPCIVALMVALLTFSMVGLGALHDSVGQWSGQIEGSLSIQVPPTELAKRSPEQREAALQKTVDTIIDELASLPGIARIEELSPETMAALLEPWLGPDEVVSELPIPRIIEITPETGFNFDALERQLGEIAPEAVLDDHRIWIERIADVAFSVELALTVLIIVLFGATMLSIVFATKSGFSIHHKIIELLHLIGAQDDYIARQFGRHSQRLAFFGALVGLLISLAVSAFIAWLGLRAGWPIPSLVFSPVFIALIVAIPFIVALVAYLTATRTVLRVLRQML
ncbi:cell division protein FtsX [Thalassospira lucentensis]|uniref:Cell division protein n=1 Tax=Thalassospira lucentensis TaxID=168935 RepID=A0A358HX67_9PROT|nr:cell division protein [Thalassospira lucentensis]RCK30734.1 cell division protein [Thalassospira lucentensis MCCC 1A00383 = DSM 14000]HBU99770.1 cell division protein [Thalassospira lucentensis]HCW65975.1 cell division protein [Thalassospira lucentensis]|tara:strand:- start:61 stop:963 length:903 start_codon:yes stop_codon:yes gene_type:complete